MTAPLRIAIAGLGTVGAGLVDLIARNQTLLTRRAGRQLEIVAVSARDRGRDRGIDLSAFAWFDDPAVMAAEAECDVVVELIGGEAGVAAKVVETALSEGRHIVTANKALMAHHGARLARLAQLQGRALAFEAAVAGGIPVIKALREGLSANRITGLRGILNGTCNYILTEMAATKRAFDDVLAEAQTLGYAEADPSFDIDGVDAAHKLALLAAIAFGREVDFGALHVEGIRGIDPRELSYAEELGYKLKLLGIARPEGEGILQSVYPCLIAAEAQIAAVDGVLNAVDIAGEPIGEVLLVGPGAGAGATASAVASDIVDIAAGRFAPVFGQSSDDLEPAAVTGVDSRYGSFYLRLAVTDKAGVVAHITRILADHDISVEDMIQRHAGQDGEPVTLVLTTHATEEAAMRNALAEIEAYENVSAEPVMLRIES